MLSETHTIAAELIARVRACDPSRSIRELMTRHCPQGPLRRRSVCVHTAPARAAQFPALVSPRRHGSSRTSQQFTTQRRQLINDQATVLAQRRRLRLSVRCRRPDVDSTSPGHGFGVSRFYASLVAPTSHGAKRKGRAARIDPPKAAGGRDQRLRRLLSGLRARCNLQYGFRLRHQHRLRVIEFDRKGLTMHYSGFSRLWGSDRRLSDRAPGISF